MDRLINKSADALVSQLVKSGVRQFFIAPGSRSTPLVAAADEHPLAETFVHFDERGLGFYALGYAKATKNPTAIIVTSGSALGHLYPAVMEAYSSEIPLLILTADRPPELLDCGENQTANQMNFFGTYVQWCTTIPPIDEETPASMIPSIAAYAVSKAKGPEPGPVQINCMFREPFFTPTKGHITPPLKSHLSGKSTLSTSDIESIAMRLSQHKRGIILAGNYQSARCNEVISTLSRRMNWPVVSCITSPYRSGKDSRYHVHYSDLLLEKLPIAEVDCVLQIGDRFVSKHLGNMLQQTDLNEWIVLSETGKRLDRGLAVTTQISAAPLPVLNELVKSAYTDATPSWPQSWVALNKKTVAALHYYFDKDNTFSEYHVFHELSSLIHFKGAFFFGNSLTIRNADALFYPHFETTTFSSRGISGIDGHIATTAGLAQGKKAPIISIMGDQTFLHDMNSLPLLAETKSPVLLFVINNGGGKIFSFLPIKERKDLHTPYFYNPHKLELSKLPSFFNIDTMKIHTIAEFQQILDSFLAHPRTLIVEVEIKSRCITEEKEALNAFLAKKNEYSKT